MDDNFAIILVLAVSIAGAVGLIIATRWLKLSRNEGAGSGTATRATSITRENEELRAQVRDLTGRLASIDVPVTNENRTLARDSERSRLSE